MFSLSLQAEYLTVIFTIVLAWFNSVPVRSMINYGVKNWESSEFHQANAVVKILWALGLFYFGHFHWLLIPILLLIQWLIFDPVLNFFIGHTWYYLGTTAKLDRLIKNGKLKAVIVLLVIIALNFIHGLFI